MDSRRELQGPRPTPLKIRKDSYKIRKPPLAPNPSHAPPPPQQQRAPVIIYTVSPKVIHANPADFMTLVQRLTGPSSSAEPSFDNGAPSPAARVAAFQKADSPRGGGGGGDSMRFMDDQISMETQSSGITAQYCPSSILSPMPGSLPPISPGYFFSPSFDPSTFLMSPNNFMASPGNKFMSSPGGAAFSFTPNLPSPGALLDLFNQLKD